MKRIKVTDTPTRRIDPAEVAKALGAEDTGIRVKNPWHGLHIFMQRRQREREEREKQQQQD